MLKLSYQITISQSGRKKIYQVEAGADLLEIINKSDFYLPSYCGGQGICGKCRVLMRPEPETKDPEREMLSSQEIQAGVRLACLHQVESDLEVDIEEGGEINILTGEEEVSCSLSPGWHQSYLKIEEPELYDQRSYLTRVFEKASCGSIEPRALDRLEDIVEGKLGPLGKSKDSADNSRSKTTQDLAAVIQDERVVDLRPADRPGRLLGAAVDIGTTTLVFYLLDLESGRQLAVDSAYNPQKKFGADVITRVQHTQGNPEGIKELRDTLVKALNRGLAETAAEVGSGADNIYRLTLAGNTIMLHTLLGKDCEKIARSPFVPLFSEQLSFRPEALSLELNPGGEVELLPSISGYVGADITADMLATGVGDSPEYQLLIDIGTNGEIALGRNDKIYACSVAAGPSFEGGNISSGMAALPGAVDSFKIFMDRLEYTTIKGEKPRGICGSGLLDLIGGLLKIGIITESGALQQPESMPEFWRKRYQELEEVKALKLFSQGESRGGREIYLTQKDIRQLQLAKGAIRAGIEILQQEADISKEEIKDVYLVGGFANYLAPEMACRIGMVPEVLSDRIQQAGNGAGAGARMMLLNRKLAEKAQELKEKTSYLELSSNMKFQKEFTGQMSF